jgi:uncharacterized cupin superfamily protein
MNETPAPPSRSRFRNVVNALDVPVQSYESLGFDASSREIALALGARDLGYCITSVPPGGRSCPFHFHHSEEEAFYVLEGRGLLRQGDCQSEDELLELGPGDFAAFPAGTGVAHQFLNRSDAPFVYLAISNQIRADIAEHPDSDKINIRSARLMLRRTPTLEYFDGES